MVLASEAGTHNPVFPIIGTVACFSLRVAGIYLDWNVPRPPGAGDNAH